MKLTKILLVAGLAASISASALAGIGFDTYNVPRIVPFPGGRLAGVVSGATTNGFLAGTPVTNGPIDIGIFGGVGSITFLTATNVTQSNSVAMPGGPSTGTLTAQVYGSPDTTNLYALTNFALINGPTMILITNQLPILGGTNAAATNYTMMPWTMTTPTAATAGYATPAPVRSGYQVFTNGGAITVTPGAPQSNYWTIGFQVSDQYRYLYVVWTPSATTGTNFLGTAFFNGVPN